MYHVRLLEVTRITGQPLQLLHVTEEQIYRDTLYVLIGVPSTTYIFYPVIAYILFHVTCNCNSTEFLSAIFCTPI